MMSRYDEGGGGQPSWNPAGVGPGVMDPRGIPQFRNTPVQPAGRGTAINPRTQAIQGRGKGTGKVISNKVGNYARPAGPPPATAGPITPSIESYLGGDVGYQSQLRDYGQALNDFLADVTRRRGTLDTEYGVSKKALDDQRLKDLSSLEADFGSRGLLRSGLYGQEVGNYEKEFGNRSSDLSRRQTEATGLLEQEKGKFGSTQELQKQRAREEAIRRRAEQYGAV